MSEVSVLSQAAHRIMERELGSTGTSHEKALAASMVYGKLLVQLSVFLGEFGSFALFRHSLRRTKATFPFFTEVLDVESPAFMNVLRVCLEKQNPECAAEASIALLTSFVELLATFIGGRLTCRLLQDLWPDICTFQPKEMAE